MSFLDFSGLGLPVNLAVFAVAAVFVWAAGTKLTRYLDVIAERTGMGEAVAGMLLMGTITSLPEIATVASSSYAGNAALATNNLLGSVSINVVLIAVADAVLGRDAITSTVGRPTTMMQGVLVVIVMTLTAIAVLVGDVSLGWFGAWSLALLAFGVLAFWQSSRYAGHAPWRVGDGTAKRNAKKQGNSAAQKQRRVYMEMPLGRLVGQTVLAALIILVAGFVLGQCGDAIAKLSGLGSGIIGLVLVGFATSLPELSSITMAVRLRRYEMALGDVFGTNLLTIGLIFLADLVYAGEPILNKAGRFEAVAALMGVTLTCIFIVGLLERENRTVFRMGYDSLAALLVFAGGVTLLFFLR